MIAVPQPPPGSGKPDRKISGLLREHIMHIHEVEMTLPPAQQTGLDITKIETVAQAGEYIERMTAILHPVAQSGGGAR
jgi:hypothetical protein